MKPLPLIAKVLALLVVVALLFGVFVLVQFLKGSGSGISYGLDVPSLSSERSRAEDVLSATASSEAGSTSSTAPASTIMGTTGSQGAIATTTLSERERALIEDPRFERLPDGRSTYRESLELAKKLVDPTHSPAVDLETVDALFGAYLWAFKELPEGGENHEVVAGLTGKNPKGVVFLPPDHPRLDDRGNLLDRWGTPYFFHKQSESELEIVSAGPDRRLWSQDDVKILRESSL